MFYVQNSFSLTIITYIVCQLIVELLKSYSSELTKKCLLCFPARPGDLGGSSGSICLCKAKTEANLRQQRN